MDYDIQANIFKKLLSKENNDVQNYEQILRKLDQQKNILDQVKKLNLQIYQEEKTYEEKVKEIRIEIQKIQKECQHFSTTRIPDPAGGRSEEQCDICGKYL